MVHWVFGPLKSYEGAERDYGGAGRRYLLTYCILKTYGLISLVRFYKISNTFFLPSNLTILFK